MKSRPVFAGFCLLGHAWNDRPCGRTGSESYLSVGRTPLFLE
jgi:hypothetical protein